MSYEDKWIHKIEEMDFINETLEDEINSLLEQMKSCSLFTTIFHVMYVYCMCLNS